MSKQKETERKMDKPSEKDTLFQAMPAGPPGIQLGLGKQLSPRECLSQGTQRARRRGAPGIESV